MNDDATNRFISSLVKSLQSLCQGYVEFEKNIEIIGHIYVNVDSNKKFDYIVNEQVCKNDNHASTLYVSNSFHAQSNKSPVRNYDQNDLPLDLKTHAKDFTGVDLSTFHTDQGQGRSASRESSQSLSAGSESGSLSGATRESRQNPDKYISRRKRHLNEVSIKQSPDVSPPPSRYRGDERREIHDAPSLRSQYTLGASASKLARRISNELEKQTMPNPVHLDNEILSRLSTISSNHGNHSSLHNAHHESHNRRENSLSQRQFDSSNRIDSVKDPPDRSESRNYDDSIDLTLVKEEVTDDDPLFDQVTWTRPGHEPDHDTSFPRTGPDEPAAEGHDPQSDPTDDLGSSPLYPVMLQQNATGMSMSGYGSPVFPQNFSEPSSLSAGSSPIPSTSGQLSPASAFSNRGQARSAGRGVMMVNCGDFVQPTGIPVRRDNSPGYRERLKQENPGKWLNYMWRERERIKRDRAILKGRDDEQALLKKERIRIQNRIRKRRERQRKRERAMMTLLKTEPGTLNSSQPQMQNTDSGNTELTLHPALRGLISMPQQCNVNM